MGALLESGKVGKVQNNHHKIIKEDTIQSWDELGFLKGLKGHLKENMAQLFENQAQHLISEASNSDTSGSFETVVFPIVRRVFSKLLANDIVSVQAMNMPIGRLFYYVPKIQERQGNQHYKPFGAPGADANEVPGQGYDTGKNLYDRFYEGSDPNEDPEGLFDYSKGEFDIVQSNATVVTWDNGELVDADLTALGGTELREVILKVEGFNSDGAGKLIGPNGQEMDSETFLSTLKVMNDNTGFLFNVVTQKYGKGIVQYGRRTSTQFPGGKFQDICDADGVMYLKVDLSKPLESGDTATMDGYKGTELTEAELGAFEVMYKVYKDLEFEDRIGEVSFDLESVTVSATDRKLRAQWSPELAQDVSAFHNIDAEAELTALLSEQIAAEIDREILRDLRKGAAWTLRWDYNGWKNIENGSVNYNQKDWNQTLITAINQVSAQIHKSTLRGGANWIVVSSEISAIFDDLEYFHVSNAAPEQDNYNMGIERVGSLQGRYQVYRDPYFPPNTVLLGHKGNSLLDTGYVYAPYVPLQLTPTLMNPFNFTPIKGIMTRYAKKMVNNRFYGRINVDNVRTFDLRELR